MRGSLPPGWLRTIREDHLDLQDNTTFDVSTSSHGFVPKALGGTTKFLREDGSWATVGAGGVTTGTAALLATEILADTPTAYWKCDDSGSTLADSSGNGNTLTLTGTTTVNHSPLLSNDTTKYLRIAAGANGATVTSVIGTSPPLTGDWTIEIILMPETVSTTNGVFGVGSTATAETEVTNCQASIFISNTGVLSTNWESGAGTDRVTNSPYASVVRGSPQHLVAVKDGTANTVTFFRNGRQLAGAVSYTTEPTGGTDSAMVTTIGDPSGASSQNMVVGHCAFYNGAKLSANRIYAHALAAGLTGS